MSHLTRRRFLALGAGAMALVACGAATPAPTPTAIVVTATPEAEVAATAPPTATPEPTVAVATATPEPTTAAAATATPEPAATVTSTASPAPTVVADPEPQATGKPPEATIRYTDGGFVPDEVEISLGGTVHFRNESSRQMWIASNPHPTHTDYPELNSQRGLANGETYSFAFARAGKWGFHNHLQPSDDGEVEVE